MYFFNFGLYSVCTKTCTLYVQCMYSVCTVSVQRFIIFWLVHQWYVPCTYCVQKSFIQKSGFSGSPESGPAAESKSIKVFIQALPLPPFPFAGAGAAAGGGSGWPGAGGCGAAAAGAAVGGVGHTRRAGAHHLRRGRGGAGVEIGMRGGRVRITCSGTGGVH